MMTRRAWVLVAGVAVLAGCAKETGSSDAANPPRGQPTTDLPKTGPANEPTLGKGWFSVTGSSAPTRIITGAESAEFYTTGAGTSFDGRIVHTYDGLQSVVTQTLSVSGRYKSLTGSAAAKYVESQKKTRDRIYAVVIVSTVIGRYEVDSAKLTDEAVAQATADTDKQFYEKHGDSGVRKAVYGGHLMLIASVARARAEKSSSFSSEIEAELAGVGSGKVRYDRVVDIVKSIDSVEVRAFALGTTVIPAAGLVTQPFSSGASAVDSMTHLANKFNGSVKKESAGIVRIETEPFIRATNWPRSRPFADVEPAIALADQLQQLHTQLGAVRGAWQEAEAEPLLFGEAADTALTVRRAREAIAQLSEIETRTDAELRAVQQNPFVLGERRAGYIRLKTDLERYDDPPARKSFPNVTLMYRYDMLKRDPSSGNGLLLNQTQPRITTRSRQEVCKCASGGGFLGG